MEVTLPDESQYKLPGWVIVVVILALIALAVLFSGQDQKMNPRIPIGTTPVPNPTFIN